ncbi:hypothetical protein BCR42DRAFT_426233 [Absidia repens]|uniref:Uncharacterized protein n=1 Tax=Absidia repens TaxID=90262 RepID=A0A1X2I1Y1_9FUNG|nr:hypothetical protein BCR42DRAFT_426233 [Absidia repens]
MDLILTVVLVVLLFLDSHVLYLWHLVHLLRNNEEAAELKMMKTMLQFRYWIPKVYLTVSLTLILTFSLKVTMTMIFFWAFFFRKGSLFHHPCCLVPNPQAVLTLNYLWGDIQKVDLVVCRLISSCSWMRIEFARHFF